MLFNSLEFALFFLVVTAGYYLAPHRWRWAWLLAASCWFYMAFVPIYILILGGTIVVDYWAGLAIEGSMGPRRRAWLVLSLVANLGVLASFKYWNFLNENLTLALAPCGWTNPVPYLNMLLPIGLSFHTFQAMSYTIEVYRGRQAAERHFGIYALYVMFYPQLVAGPIERPQNMLHQFRERHPLLYQNLAEGLKLMAWGLFKKVVLADRLALVVNQVYNDPYEFEGLPLVLGTVLFAFQIYCDFSGYSDMALGSAQAMGFSLMRNFNRPYFSKSVGEFWGRWHISLSTWFRDYLYIPLGGNRVGPSRLAANLMTTFTLSGLWHGAAWTYVVWGALNGAYLVAGHYLTPRARLTVARARANGPGATLSNILRTAGTFTLICTAWVFFRAMRMADARWVLTHGLRQLPTTVVEALQAILKGSYLGQTTYIWGIMVLSLAILLVAECLQRAGSGRVWLQRQHALLRYGFYVCLCLAIVWGAVMESGSQFIYFQF